MDRILVVNVNWVGDVIFSAPIFKSLRMAYPNAKICCLAVPRVKEILESITQIDEIIIYDEKGRDRNPLAKLMLILKLRRKKFDIVFLLHRSMTRALLVYLAGIPQRVGYDTKNRGRFLTHKVDYSDNTVHRCDYYLNVIESYGIKVDDRRYELSVEQNAVNDIEKILRSKDIQAKDYLVVMNPGGNWDLKRWSGERFSRLINGFKNQSDIKVAITGSKKDRSLIKAMGGLSLDHALDLSGQTNLKQLMALMKRANLVISADSGPLHLANGVGCDVIGIYGPTRPEITGPRGSGKAYLIQYDVGCNRDPCYHLKCPDNICMQSVMVDDVLKIIKKIRNS